MAKQSLPKPISVGKVRSLYKGPRQGTLIQVASDNISCFDSVLDSQIPGKGQILTQMSIFWFEMTKDITRNHFQTALPENLPRNFQGPKYDGRTMLCKRLDMLPIECIVRGYITGSGWNSYRKTGQVCGIELPAGLQESEQLPEPIYTPSTKAAQGEHDENISFTESIQRIYDWLLEDCYEYDEDVMWNSATYYANVLQTTSLALYQRAAAYALSKGVIIADTKFEFGLDENGYVVLADEVLTPDSSRFWPLKGYQVGQRQPSFDKQIARDYLNDHPKAKAANRLPDKIIQQTAEKYQEIFQLLVGNTI